MALPAAVQKQIDEANAVAAQVYGTKEEPAVGSPPPEGSAPPPDVTPPPNAPLSMPQAEWEQKYKVLQGKYNAEVPRLQTQIKDLMTSQANLQSQLTGTQTLLSTLSQAKGATNTSTATPEGGSKLVKPEEVAEYGADLYDFIKRTARESVLPEVDSRLRPMSQQVEQVSRSTASIVNNAAKTEEQKVHELLNTQVPNWLELNEDETFLAWLDQTDPYAGEPRAALLNRAYKRYDGPRVVAFFRGFLNENATVAPQTAPAPGKGTPAVSLTSMVAPGTQRAGAQDGAPDGGNKRIYTQQDIAQFYKDVSGGKYARSVDRRNAIEADIFAAQREGRIR